MTPPPNADPLCGGCYLYERRGVCPAARDAYGLENSAAAERRAEEFHQAVAAEAQRHGPGFHEAVAREAVRTFTLADLVQIEAEGLALGAARQSAAWPLPARAVADLSAATAEAAPDLTPTRKEAAHVPVARQP